MNGRAFIRVVEALLASAAMIAAAMFIASEQAGTVQEPTFGGTVKIKQMGNDILTVLENNTVMYEGEQKKELPLYIRTKDQYTLTERLKDIIPQDYTYQCDIYKIENAYVISTLDQAVDVSGLTNGYNTGALTNYNDIWHYKEGGYTFDLPDIDDASVTLLVVDTTNESPYNAFDYNAVYLNFNNNESFVSDDTLPVNPIVPLKSRDIFRIYDDTTDPNVQYELEFLVSKITPDGNSVSFGLIAERLIIELDNTMERENVSVMDDLYHFKVETERGRYVLYYDKNDPDDATGTKEYQGPYIEGGRITIEEYDVSVNKITNNTVHLTLFAYRRKSMSVSTLVPATNRVVCNRVLAVREGNDVNFYYIRLALGRKS